MAISFLKNPYFYGLAGQIPRRHWNIYIFNARQNSIVRLRRGVSEKVECVWGREGDDEMAMQTGISSSKVLILMGAGQSRSYNPQLVGLEAGVAGYDRPRGPLNWRRFSFSPFLISFCELVLSSSRSIVDDRKFSRSNWLCDIEERSAVGRHIGASGNCLQKCVMLVENFLIPSEWWTFNTGVV